MRNIYKKKLKAKIKSYSEKDSTNQNNLNKLWHMYKLVKV